MRVIHLIFISLTGCVSTYSPAISGDSVPLTIQVDPSSLGHGAVVQAQNYADATCRPGLHGTRIAIFSSANPSSSATGSTHLIPANKPFIFTFYRFAGAMGFGDCKATYSFTPKIGASYRASFSGTCSASIRYSDNSPIEDLQPINPPCYK